MSNLRRLSVLEKQLLGSSHVLGGSTSLSSTKTSPSVSSSYTFKNIERYNAAFVLANVDPSPGLQLGGSLAGKTLFITGASRGIGLAIAKRAARDGANVVIAAKTKDPHPKLPGTIYTAAEEIRAAGGRALPVVCDIRSEESVEQAVEAAVKEFGGIDILVNNASAISLTNTEETPMKRYDLMHHVNTRGTFLASQKCLPYLKKAQNPHILNISPPLNMEMKWFQNHVAYTMAKFGMSMCVLGMSGELAAHNISVNALWPRTAIATAAVQNVLGGDEAMRLCRTADIMADAAHIILTSDNRSSGRKKDKTSATELSNNSGNFYVDDEVLASVGIVDLEKYSCDASVRQTELMPDFFV